MSDLQVFPAAAGYSHSLHSGLNGSMNSASRHYNAGHDDVFDMPVETAIGSLPRVKGEPVKTVPQVLGVGQATDVSIRHDGRLDKLMLHYFPRKGLPVCTSLSEANHCIGPTTSYKFLGISTYARIVSRRNEQFIKSGMTQRQPTHNQHNTNVNPLSAFPPKAFRSPALSSPAPGTPIIGAA